MTTCAFHCCLLEIDFTDLPARHREEIAGKELTNDSPAADRSRVKFAALLHPLHDAAGHDERVNAGALENGAIDRSAIELETIMAGALVDVAVDRAGSDNDGIDTGIERNRPRDGARAPG
jgi:hypothetical protein